MSLANEAYELIDEYMKQLDNDILRLEDEVACVCVHVCVYTCVCIDEYMKQLDNDFLRLEDEVTCVCVHVCVCV